MRKTSREPLSERRRVNVRPTSLISRAVLQLGHARDDVRRKLATCQALDDVRMASMPSAPAESPC